MRLVIAGLIAGLIVGAIGGLFFAAKVQITSDQWWSLAGSLGGVILAIAGSIIVFHYQSTESERADRKRIAKQIESAMRHVKTFERAASSASPDVETMRREMRQMAQEHNIVKRSLEQFRHTSSEIARASKHFGTAVPDRVSALAGYQEKDNWSSEAIEAVRHLKRVLEVGHAELRV